MLIFPCQPIPIPVPERLLLFAPHPDDIAISMGALTAQAARWKVPTTAVLFTDGSEARLPENVLQKHGADSQMPAQRQRELRGQIRVAESVEEICRLGFEPSVLIVLERQRWFREHKTPPDSMFPDLSLRDVKHFVPGPIDEESLLEVREIIGTGQGALCCVPDSNDRLAMHRIVCEIVTKVRGRAGLLTYECFSTIEPTGEQTIFGFGEDLLLAKLQAVRAHQSMLERRKQFGGYTNSGSQFYDEMVAQRNAQLARSLDLESPYAERYGWRP